MKYQTPQRCVLLVILMIVFYAAKPGMGLVVSELMYHPLEEGNTSDGSETLEFIELYNNRAVIEDLTGYAFTNGIGYVFEPGTTIGPKQYMVIASNPAALEAAYDITGVLGPFTGRFDNDGEQVELSNGNGEIIISFRYNDTKPWSASPDGTGHSLILAKQGGDTEEASTWSPSTFIGGTPGGPDEVQLEDEDPTLITLIDVGHPGRYFKGYEEPSPGPGGQATTAWTQINFNDNPNTTDWLEGPNGYGYSNDSAELQTVRTQLNDMAGNYISIYARLRFTLTAEQINSFSQMRADVYYDDDYVLYLNGTRVGTSGGITGNPPPFNAGRGSGSDFSPANVDLTDWVDRLVVGTNVLAVQVHNASISGSSDCIASLILRAVIELPEGGDDPRARVVINEVMADSDSGGDWIELYNPGPIPVDMSNLYLSDDRLDLLKYKIPDGVVLQPGDFWAVDDDEQSGGLSFSLKASGETVYLTATTSGSVPFPVRVLDSLRYPNMEPEVSYGRFPDGSGFFDFLSSSSYGVPNAQPLIRDIVINEIMYHPILSDDRYEYIELYNKGTDTISLSGWSFTDGIEYEFDGNIEMAPDSYLVVAKDPDLLMDVYDDLVFGSNLVGPYTGSLNDHSERIRLSYPLEKINSETGEVEVDMITIDEVTYYDGGRWPDWADGQGASLELRDPTGNNDTPGAWADSDESDKTTWQQFSFTINSNDSSYTHDRVTLFDFMLLNRGEIMVDDLELLINGSQRLSNRGFESGESGWRILGNHVQSFVTTADRHSGSRSLHLVATGHGDPGANRINQSITGVTGGTITFRGWARWLRGSRFLLLRTVRERAPVQPPRPSRRFELDIPLDIGTPGFQNTAFVSNRGPDILEVKHEPVLPVSGEPIVVTVRVVDNSGIGMVTLYYRSEGTATFTSTSMVDDGSGDDVVGGDGIFTAAIPGAGGGTMRAFYIIASDGRASTRFPTRLQDSADVPDRTCLVRVGDSLISTQFATYRVWISNDVINTFRSRVNLSNELMDCTFVYNDTDIFYNAHVRLRGSAWLRPGHNWDLRDRHAYRIEFNPDQRFRGREEINLDMTEGSSRGPLQERASYWFYQQMGLQFSRQEFIRPIINGRTYGDYEDVQKVDRDYIRSWFPDDADGRLHEVDDYFEFSSDGSSQTNLDEGLKYDSSHPLIPETYRWEFEKRSHPQDDNWDHVFDFIVALNASSSSPVYERTIESVIHPEHFARVLAIRHAVGDWDSYGYRRGKNNSFYYAPNEGKWYLLPWDIDFTLGSGDGATTNLFSIGGHFPEVNRFLSYPKYRRMYLQAFAELVNGPWQTSYGTGDPPTLFDQFLDDAADALVNDGLGSGRRNGIKQFVRSRRNYIISQIPSVTFRITTNGGRDFYASGPTVTISGTVPLEVAQISINGIPVETEISGDNVFTVNVEIQEGTNVLNIQGINGVGKPVSGASGSITVTRVNSCSIRSVTPNPVYNTGTVELTILGSGFEPGTQTAVALTSTSGELGFNAFYVQNSQAFGSIEDATLLLDNPNNGVGNPVRAVHTVINLFQTGSEGIFTPSEMFASPFNIGDPSNFAVRFTGYIFAPSAGTRYFGVNSDDGFNLWIDNRLVGQYAQARAPATTDALRNRTAGTMTFDFANDDGHFLMLDFYENAGGEEIEFFETDARAGNPRLINDNSDLIVLQDDLVRIDATDVVVEDQYTIVCSVDLTGARPGYWNLIVIPESGEAAQCYSENAIQILPGR